MKSSTTASHDRRRAIDGVALADATKVRAHSLACEEGRALRVVHLELLVVDERQTRQDVGARRNISVDGHRISRARRARRT